MCRPVIVDLCERPERIPAAAAWFAEKWGVPQAAYAQSMARAGGDTAVPRWYVALCGDAIIGGVGVIENDFHTRPDLTPNVCALYVEAPYRGQGLARGLRERGVRRAYLLTGHTRLYERMGWQFYGMVEENGGGLARMYQKDL